MISSPANLLPPAANLEAMTTWLACRVAGSGLQAGFWCGGDLPWAGSPAVALGIGALPPLAEDSGADADGDGLPDWDEVWTHGTDPFMSDTDGDGMADGDEVAQGTNPLDAHSFVQSLTVSVTNTAGGFASHVAWGYSPDGWEANGLVAFPSGSGALVYTDASASAATHVKAFCDLDGDGEYSPDADILLVRSIPPGSAANIAFAFGDVDNDGVADAQERADGTDPFDAKNFAFSMYAHFTGVFHTTNSLSAVLRTSSETLYGPVALTNGTEWTFATNSQEVTSGGKPYFQFWDDANSNGVRELSEAATSYTPSPFARDMAFTNRMSYGSFDKDSDGMLDWWELQHGLSPTNAADAAEDPDGDTLLNVHEFLSGTDPFVLDGTNTLIYLLIHSIDDRLMGKNPDENWHMFPDIQYVFTNMQPVVISSNCWLSGVTLPCAPERAKMPGENLWRNGLTPFVIGARHLMYAEHCHWVVGTIFQFRIPGGATVERTLIATTNVLPRQTDIAIGLLDNPLPDEIPPVRFMPHDFRRYIGKGTCIPVVRIDQYGRAIVQEISYISESRWDYIRFRGHSFSNPIRTPFWAPAIMFDSAYPNFMLCGDAPVFLYPTSVSMGDTHDGSALLPIEFKTEIEAAADQMGIDHGVTNKLELLEFDFNGIGGHR